MGGCPACKKSAGQFFLTAFSVGVNNATGSCQMAAATGPYADAMMDIQRARVGIAESVVDIVAYSQAMANLHLSGVVVLVEAFFAVPHGQTVRQYRLVARVDAAFSVTPEQWGRFLCEIFDEWVREDVGNYFIQLFDATLANYAGVEPGVCSMASSRRHLAETKERHCLGNVANAGLRESVMASVRKTGLLRIATAIPD